MADSSRSAQSSVEQPGLFPFSNPPPVSSGPQTIIHPDRRGASLPVPASFADSSVWSKLFPQVAQHVDADADKSVTGVELAHFVIERRIGAGGMGAVFRAVDRRLDRIVALKILGPNQSHDPASVQRFHNEARASARLDHDNVARVFFSGEDRGIHFIAYEFVVGTTVRDLIREAGRLTSIDAVNYTLQVAAALRHMTAAGVVHRDIKPSNIIIGDNGRAKLLDLGLARQSDNDSGTDLTIAGTTLGTFDYISPEQAKDPRKVDVRSDIYSLGCTLYHMLTGSAPYPEGTVLQKLLDHQDAKLPDPREKNPSISRQLSAVVQRMMASNPDERYQRPDDVMTDLMIIAGSLGLRAASPEGIVWSVPRIVRPRFWERNLGWVAMGAALLLIVGLLRWSPSFEPTSHKKVETGHQATNGTGAIKPAPEQPVDTGQRSANGFVLDPDEMFDPTNLANIAPLSDLESRKFSDDGWFGNPNLTKLRGSTLPPPANFSPESTAETSTLPPRPLDDELPVVAPKPLPAAVVAANGERQGTPPAPFVVNPPVALPAVALMSESGNVEPYPTLEAACRAAVDGSVIVLNYDGRRVTPPERRMKVENKRVTIRAGKRADGSSFRPQLVFEAAPKTADGDTRMFTLVGGGIKLINVDLKITVREGVESDQWAAFSCVGANRVRLQGSRVTFENAANKPAAVFELKPGSRLDKMNSTMPGSASAENTEIEIEKSLVRGDCDLMIVKHTDPGRIKIDHSIIAVAGSVLSITGDRDMPQESTNLEVQLDHITCLVGKGLLTMNSGEESRELLPVTVVASNNVFATRTTVPFVFMTGNTNSQDFGTRFHWDGEKNVFNGFEKMWVVQPTSISAGFDEHRFDKWLRLWNSDTEVNVTNRESFWRRDASAKKPLAQIEPADFALDEEHEHPTISEGTDGETVGADLTQFEAPTENPEPAVQSKNGEHED